MYYKNILKLITISLLITTIHSCKDDEETEVTPLPIVKTETTIESIINDSISININPSGMAPLTAELEFSTKSVANVEITVLGDIPINKTFAENQSNHIVPVLGLYQGVENKVVLKLSTTTNYAIDTLIIKTDSLPSFLPEVIINTSNPVLMEAGMHLNALHITDGVYFNLYPLVFDNNGDVRWILDFKGLYLGFRAPVELTSDGNLLFETSNAIKEYSLMGRELKSIDIPSGYKHSHHDVIKLNNGNYVVPVDKDGSVIVHNGQTYNSVEDAMVEINGISGSIVTEWDFKQLLDVDRIDITNPFVAGSNTVDWFHQNAVNVDPSDNTFIVSGKNQGLFKVDRNSNVKWILAPHRNWGRAGANGDLYRTDSLLLTAVNSSGVAYDTSVQNGSVRDVDFDWAWGQHAPVFLPNGNLLVFDNGFNRQFGNASNYSRAVEYKINEANKTIEQVWEYGENRGTETYSSIISDVDYLPNTGNILFSPGIMFGVNESKIIEIAYHSNMVVFEATLKYKNERSTGGGFGQFDLTYRAERISLYP